MILTQGVADLTLRRMVVTNAGAGYGPALYVGGNSRIDRVTVTESVATESGGGIRIASGANVTIVDSTFHDNRADFGAGIYVSSGATATIIRTTVSDNVALFEGGGIYGVGAEQVTVANSTVFRNGGNDGAGIYMSNSDLTVHNSTITRNESAGGGGGLSIDPGPVNVLVNSIVTGNTDEAAGTTTDDIWGTLDTDLQNLVGAEADGRPRPGGPRRQRRPDEDRADRAAAPPRRSTRVTTATCHNDNVDGVDQRGFTRPSTRATSARSSVDLVAPVMDGRPTAPSRRVPLAGTKARIQLGWSGSDAGGSGIALFRIERSVDGGAWTEVGTTTVDDAELVLPAKGARYRVIPIDYDGNVGPRPRPDAARRPDPADVRRHHVREDVADGPRERLLRRVRPLRPIEGRQRAVPVHRPRRRVRDDARAQPRQGEDPDQRVAGPDDRPLGTHDRRARARVAADAGRRARRARSRSSWSGRAAGRAWTSTRSWSCAEAAPTTGLTGGRAPRQHRVVPGIRAPSGAPRRRAGPFPPPRHEGFR